MYDGAAKNGYSGTNIGKGFPLRVRLEIGIPSTRSRVVYCRGPGVGHGIGGRTE